jgi:hypothetical protein
MVTGCVVSGYARTDDDRADQVKDSESLPTFQVTFEEPRVGPDSHSPLVLVPGSKLPAKVRVVRTGTAEPPQEKIVISFVRERDKAFGGQFLAERKQVGPDTFEYEAGLIAPAAAAKYELMTTLDKAKVPGPKPGASVKVEVK